MTSRIEQTTRRWGELPVPWFVQWYDGKPDFRVVNTPKMIQAHRHRLCLICGEPLGSFGSFVVGPMCVVNRVSSEPPSHKDCCESAVKLCPFLTDPERKRREGGEKGQTVSAAGLMVARNPGVSAIWTCRAWEAFRPHAGNPGLLWHMGSLSLNVTWWARGRPATRDEVETAMDAGLPSLTDLAEAQGEQSVKDLDRAVVAALTLLPDREAVAAA